MSSQDINPRPGDMVILTRIPPGLLEGLPIEDQHAIRTVLGKPVLLAGFDDSGIAELEFVDASGAIHYIYVASAFIRPDGPS